MVNIKTDGSIVHANASEYNFFSDADLTDEACVNVMLGNKNVIAAVLDIEPLLQSFIAEPLKPFDLRKKYSARKQRDENTFNDFSEDIDTDRYTYNRDCFVLRNGNNDIYINTVRSNADDLLIHGGYFQFYTEKYIPTVWYKNGKALGWRGPSSFDLCIVR